MLELARERDIQVYTHEQGRRFASIAVYENLPCSHLHLEIQKYWQDWKNIPLQQHELQTIHKYMTDREKGTEQFSWVSFQHKTLMHPKNHPLETNSELQALNIDLSKPLILLFPSSDDEMVDVPNHIFPFKSQQHWLEFTLEFARQHPETQWIIRAHPNISGEITKKQGMKANSGNQQQMAALNKLKQNLPQNARLIIPDETLNSYNLMNIASVGIALLSTAAFEMACKGKRCLVGPNSCFGNSCFVQTSHSLEEYRQQLEAAIKLERNHIDPQVSLDAYRFAYYLFFRWSLFFPLIQISEEPGQKGGKPAFERLSELDTGYEENLDYICKIILDHAPICRPPSLYHLSLDDRDERLFYGHLPKQSRAINIKPKTLFSQAYSQFKPLVSVLISVKQQAHSLYETLENLLAHNKEYLEILIFNHYQNPSENKLFSNILQVYQEQAILIQHTPFETQEASGLNELMQKVRGHYVLHLHAGEKISPQFLSLGIQTLGENPAIGFIYPQEALIGKNYQLLPVQNYDPQHLPYENYLPRAKLFRHKIWQALNGYDPQFHHFIEWDFWLSALKQHNSIGIHLNKLIWHHQTAPQNESNLEQDFHQEKALLIKKHRDLYTPSQNEWAQLLLQKGTPSSHLPRQKFQMPIFQNETLPTKVKNLGEQQKKIMEGSSAEYLSQLRNPHQIQHQYWSFQCGYWLKKMHSNANTILDWHPKQAIIKEKPSTIWVPTTAAYIECKKYLQKWSGQEPEIQILPRFCIPLKPTREAFIETKKQQILLALLNLEQRNTWTGFLSNYIKAYNPDDDIALILIFETISIDNVYTQISEFLDNLVIDDALLPDIIILDAADTAPQSALKHIHPQALFCPPAQDPSGAIWLDALHTNTRLILNTEPPAEYQSWLISQKTGEIWHRLIREDEAFQLYKPQENFLHEWNRHILLAMHETQKC